MKSLLKLKIFAINCFVLFVLHANPFTYLNAQLGNYHFNIEASAGYISKDKIPFWLRSNQYGSIPPDNVSLSLIGSLGKDYHKGKSGVFDWGAGMETRLNPEQVSLIEAYLKGRVSVLEIKAGRTKEIMGLCDTSLSTGSLSISGNAPGIPKIQAGTTGYISLPVFNRLFALKCTYSHGWLGEVPTNLNGKTGMELTYFHQMSLYGRIGVPEGKLKLHGGFNHQVFWGNEKHIFGNDFTLSVSRTYLYVITGKSYSTSIIEPSRIGNHLGSVDAGLEYDFTNFRLFMYRQNFYDFIALKHLANIADGLNGVSFINKVRSNNFFQFKKILFELLYSKDQGRSYSARDPKYYNENYYNNYIYSNGWSYKGTGLGNPFLTPKTMIKEGLSTEDYDYFVNNRVIVFHFGMEGKLENWNYVIKASYSKNYGTYFSDIKGDINQFSAFIEGNRELKKELNVGFRAAFDRGALLYKSTGFILFFSKFFQI